MPPAKKTRKARPPASRKARTSGVRLGVPPVKDSPASSSLEDLLNPKPGDALTVAQRLYVDHHTGRVSDSDALRRLLAIAAGCPADVYADERESSSDDA